MSDKKVNLERAMVWLDAEIAYHQKRHDSSVNMGWADEAQLSDEFLKLFNTIRSALTDYFRLRERMGEWKAGAKSLTAIVDAKNQPVHQRIIALNQSLRFFEKIRDFKLDGEENPSPPAKGE